MAKSKKSSRNPGSFLLLLVAVIALAVVVKTLIQNHKRTDVKALENSQIIIDHNSIALFDQIPDSYIQAAAAKKFLFIDRSVGSNINDGLNCLASGNSFASASNSCKSNLTESTYRSHTKYNRSNWVFSHYGDGGWYNNVSNYITNTNLQSATRESYTPNYSSFDVINFQFSYLDVAPTSDITSATSGFFIPYPGNTRSIRDIHDMAQFETSYPNTNFVYATTSLARNIGTTVSTAFNSQMRDYALRNNKALLDIADIESHDTSGNPCTYSGQPAMCAEYTSEANGGHLSYGLSRQRLAKAMWVLMAQLSGWEPGTTRPPNIPATSAPTATIRPTITPTRAPTSYPTPTSTPPNPTQPPVGSLSPVFYNPTEHTFNGTTNYYSLGHLQYLTNVDRFTFSIWLKPSFDETSTTRRYVFSDGTTFTIFYLEAIKNWRIAIRTATGIHRIDTVGVAWTPNTWNQMAVTYDGASAKVYWNRSWIKTQSVTGRTTSDSLPTYLGTAVFPSNHFWGSQDEVKIWNRALTESEIRSLPATP